jgi:hypothetical protein
MVFICFWKINFSFSIQIKYSMQLNVWIKRKFISFSILFDSIVKRLCVYKNARHYIQCDTFNLDHKIFSFFFMFNAFCENVYCLGNYWRKKNKQNKKAKEIRTQLKFNVKQYAFYWKYLMWYLLSLIELCAMTWTMLLGISL